MRQSEGDDMFDSVEDLFPGSMKGRGCLFPGKPASPSSQKQHISVGQLMFAVAPRNFFNDHRFAAAAVDAPHGIKQKNQKTPERDEFETPLGELIIPGCGLMAT